MSKIIDLCGNWRLYCKSSPFGELDLPATVPGCVHTDLIAANLIKDIFYRDNFKSVQWIESCDFTYTKSFCVDEVHSGAYLEFDGLDTYADVYLNGKSLGSTDNMFIPHELCVDGALVKGENVLEVAFSSPIKRVEGLPLYEGSFTRERMNTRRVQCTYSWDWVERFVTMGIFRPARLCFREKNEVASVYVYTADVNPYSAQLRLEIDIRDFCDRGDKISIRVDAPDGKTVFSKERVLINPSLHENIDVTEPLLWYPVGYGAQPLYTVTVSTATSSVSHKVGIRRVTVLQIEDTEGSEYRATSLELQKKAHLREYDHNKSTAGFTVLVNGTKIMCKGGNWVPCDPFPSEEAPEKITRLLEFAVAGGVNTVRVWGGGIFERDEFYDECDRLGILVTHDFLMACGTYPEHEAWFIEALNRETRAAALRLRNHPCLIFWCGDNENAVLGSEDRTDFTGYRSATFGIEPILSKLDPQRYFFASSPYGGDMYCSSTRGTTHVTYYLGDIFNYMVYSDMKDYREYFSGFYSRFCCEYPSFGMSFASSLEKYMTRDDIFSDDSLEMIEYHSKNNPALFKPLFRIYEDMAIKVFGEYRGGEDRIRKLQMLHCEITRLSFELYRRRKGYSWGLVYWMLNDCWPASAGWSFLDYYACPKPAYYTFKRCSKDIISTISLENGKLALHVCNDALTDVSGKARLYVYDFRAERELWSHDVAFEVRENCTEKAFECDFCELDALLSPTTVILCDTESSLGSDRAMFIKDRFADLELDCSAPVVLSESEEKLTVTVNAFDPCVIIDVPYLLSDNCFPLKAGEVKVIKKIKKL